MSIGGGGAMSSESPVHQTIAYHIPLPFQRLSSSRVFSSTFILKSPRVLKSPCCLITGFLVVLNSSTASFMVDNLSALIFPAMDSRTSIPGEFQETDSLYSAGFVYHVVRTCV